MEEKGGESVNLQKLSLSFRAERSSWTHLVVLVQRRNSMCRVFFSGNILSDRECPGWSGGPDQGQDKDANDAERIIILN